MRQFFKIASTARRQSIRVCAQGERGTEGLIPRELPDELVVGLHDETHCVIQSLLTRNARCALLDFPNHSNVGDSAIWLGERCALRRAGVSVVYACDRLSYSPDRLKARLKDGTILLHGGGNLGDVWPSLQRFREQVIAEFPDNRIIQLPQTVHFSERENLDHAKKVFSKHPNLTLLVRDRRSLKIAEVGLGTKSLLCPDMAFSLGPLRRSGHPQTDILCLGRTDTESRWSSWSSRYPEVEHLDWLDELSSDFRRYPGSTFALRLDKRLIREIGRRRRFRRPLLDLAHLASGSVVLAYDGLARARLRRGIAILSRGRVVITDRLHGHILSLMMGVPNILLDNNYGKVRSFYDTWTRRAELSKWATDPSQALDEARVFMKHVS